MGQVLIEIPQKVNRSYHVDDSAFGEQLLDELEQYSKSDQTPEIPPPRRNSLKEDSAKAPGILKDRPESAEETGRSTLYRSNGKKLETLTLDYPFDLDDVDETEAIGIWADREESSDEIARAIREKNRRGT